MLMSNLLLLLLSSFSFQGCAFIQFSRREMAVAAIKALNGIFTMRVNQNNLFSI